jgi:hypothetical protein
MDVKGSIGYRAVELNVVTTTPPEGIGGGTEGITCNGIDYADVDIDQHVDKAALKDGIETAEPYFGGRIMNLTGTVYGSNRGRFFDMVQLLRRTFNARLAYLEDPTNKGFLPLTYSVPTDRWDEFPERQIDLLMYLSPRSLKMSFDRKSSGGVDGDALATQWRSQLLASDPLIYAQVATVIAVSDVVSGATLVNRGDYPAVPAFSWIVGAAAGTITFTIDGVTVIITIPVGAVNRVFTYDGKTKMVKVDGVRRMDLMNAPVHPVIPAGGGSYSHSATVPVTGTLIYRETYA